MYKISASVADIREEASKNGHSLPLFYGNKCPTLLTPPTPASPLNKKGSISPFPGHPLFSTFHPGSIPCEPSQGWNEFEPFAQNKLRRVSFKHFDNRLQILNGIPSPQANPHVRVLVPVSSFHKKQSMLQPVVGLDYQPRFGSSNAVYIYFCAALFCLLSLPTT